MTTEEREIEKVKLLQEALNSKGFNLTVDGIWGQQSEHAFNNYLTPKVLQNQDIGDTLAQLMEMEEGVKEDPNRPNRGKRVDEYQKGDELDGEGYAWCADAVCFCLQQLSAIFTLKVGKPIYTASVRALHAWGIKLGLIVKTPKRGDIVIYDYDKKFSHTGVVTKVSINASGKLMYLETMEGNTNAEGSRDGDGFYRKDRTDEYNRGLVKAFMRVA